MSAIRPNPEQFKQFASDADTDTGPVVMLNLLKFKAGDGAREYDTYGDTARRMVEGTGGRIIYAGRCEQVLIGENDANDWDAIAVVEYPSRKALMDMMSQPDYVKAHEHREAGLERTVLIATTPTVRVAKE